MNMKTPNTKYSSGESTALKKKGLSKVILYFYDGHKIDSSSGSTGMMLESKHLNFSPVLLDRDKSKSTHV